LKLILSKTGSKLRNLFSSANESWIAVALLTLKGLSNIKINKNNNNFLVGTYLPTDPKALKKLLKLQNKNIVQAKVFTKGSFHPKVYIVKKRNKYSGIIGSSNLTEGGLNTNTEVNYTITNQKELKLIKIWFDNNFNKNINAKNLTLEFIKEYTKKYNKLKNARDRIKNINNKYDKLSDKETIFIMNRRNQLANKLKTWMKSKEYFTICKSRRNIIQEYRKYLDFPVFNNIKIDSFISGYDLGFTYGFNVPKILRQRIRFVNLIRYLADETIPIEKRIYETIKGDYRVNNVGKGIITKILITINPQKYCVWNSVSNNVVKEYGFEFPNTSHMGLKYKVLLYTMDLICNQAGLRNKAVLDYFLYKIANKK